MVGSSDSIASPNIVLNTIVAEAFADACDILEKADDFDMAVHDLIKQYANEHQRIVFNGNGYSDAVGGRGRKTQRTSEHQVHGRGDPGTRDRQGSCHCSMRFGVFTKAELESRAEVKYESICQGDQHRSPHNDRYGKQADHPGSDASIPEVWQRQSTAVVKKQAQRHPVQAELLNETIALLSDSGKVALAKPDRCDRGSSSVKQKAKRRQDSSMM